MGVLESPGKVLDFLSEKEWEPCGIKYTGDSTLWAESYRTGCLVSSYSFYAIVHICYANSVCPSVRFSVCLSHACIVSKRLNVSSKFFHDLIGPSF